MFMVTFIFTLSVTGLGRENSEIFAWYDEYIYFSGAASTFLFPRKERKTLYPIWMELM